MRILAALVAGALFALPLLTAPGTPVAVIGLGALSLAMLGLLTLWRWCTTAAACVFLVEYAAVLAGGTGAVNVLGAATYSVALLLLLHATDLGRRARHASASARIVLAHLGRWIALCVSTLAAAVLALVTAAGLAGALPFAASPFVAAVGAVSTLLAVAAVLKRAAGQEEPRPPMY